jgi:assimilatory nitrate reductase catalytic subunit
LIQNGWIDHTFMDAHSNGFEDYARFVQQFDPQSVAHTTGLSVDLIQNIAALIHQWQRVSFWWTMGVNQSHQGVRTAQAIINLALLTGHIGRPGTGANSITGQCNAMGSRLFSNTTNLLGGHDFANPEHRTKVADVLKIPEACIPSHAGWAYDQIVEGIRTGKIRGLWVIATNPAHSWIDQNSFRETLGQLDFLVVQDMYRSTETALAADLLLAAAAWGEKEGTFINSERRIGLIKKIRRAPGQALSDFHIFKLVAHYYGCDSIFADWDTPEAVFQILKRLSRGQPCDFSGVRDYRMLDDERGVQWPYPESAPDLEPQRRLFADGGFYHPDGRARFLFDRPRPLIEAPDNDYPFLLLTGRGSASQWHTQTRTAKSDVLRQLYPSGLHVEIHPDDADRIEVAPGQMVIVESRRGHVQARAFVSPTVPRGQVFLPMHDPGTNRLTIADFDPDSRQPAYKACAVRVRAAGKDDRRANASG